jgi:GT2 family glycosyltransferase
MEKSDDSMINQYASDSQKAKDVMNETVPLLSVVIPTCHRNRDLAEILKRLGPGAQQGMTLVVAGSVALKKEEKNSSTYEVIVTDDGRETTSEEMIAESYPWARWVPGPKSGPGQNRNNGTQYACGEWIAFIDDDCIPGPTWLKAIHDHVISGNVDVVEGAVYSPDLRDHPLWTAPENRCGGAGWTANLCVRRAAFSRLGGFDPDLPETAEDMEFHVRSKRAGLLWVFAPDANVIHPARKLSCKQFWKGTLQFRWWFMYLLKTRASPPVEVRAFGIFVDTARALFFLYARNTYHWIKRIAKGDWNQWKRSGFQIIWNWVLFPILLLYFAYWNYRFHQHIICVKAEHKKGPSALQPEG